MNSTADDDVFSHILVGLSVTPSILFCPFISLFLFPYFVGVNRMCRARDQRSAVFPFVSHFYRAVYFNQVLFLVCLLLMIIIILITVRLNGNYLAFLAAFPIFIHTVFLLVASYSCNVLTILLSLHRFFLYYFPTIGNRLTPSKDTATIVIVAIYVPVTVMGVVELQRSQNNEGEETAGLFFASHVVIDVLLLLATVPYFLMMRSVQKLTHLSSSIQSKPEEYIKYQIILIFLRKLATLVSVFACQLYKSDDFSARSAVFLVAEGHCTFVAIQFAYLMTNKTNVEALLKMKFSWKMLKFVFLGAKVEVQPVVSTVSSTKLQN